MGDTLAGRIAIVTGGGSGIGRATATLFAAEGAEVLIADVTGAADEAAAEIGPRARATRCDAGDEAQVRGLIAHAVAHFGGIDIVFANAGISGRLKPLFEQDAEDWAEILRVNLIGPAMAIKYAAPEIAKRGGGAIVCTSSIAGLRSGAGGPAYSASKAGIVNLVQVAAQQLAGSNVRVNAICPGLIETRMTAPIYDGMRGAGKDAEIGALNPLRRGGSPDEIARAALFLASPASSYVNGHALVVDGGHSASHPVTRQDYGMTAIV